MVSRVNSINSFDEWMQDEIVLASEKASMAYETFSLLAARWGMHKDRIRNFGHCSDAIRQCWGISEKKSSLYARYIIGYLEDKQGVAKQSYLTADDAGELMSLIGEYVSSQCRSTGKLCAFIDKLRKVAS
jgi:hypothetical protein